MCAFVRLCVRWCAVSGAGWAQRLSSRGCGGGEGLAAEGARLSESLRPAEAVREHVEEDLLLWVPPFSHKFPPLY